MPSETCAPPNRLVGERCVEPGVQDDGCPAGTLGLSDGSCQPAGVPAELCAEGFIHDGDVGCTPILPAEPCPWGQMAVPGDDACRPVMDCGAGKWGDIPIDANTIHVDAAFAGGGSDGSAQAPWTTITQAVAAAPPGALVAVAAGSYVENVVVNKPLRLWGVCPEQVSIIGSDQSGGGCPPAAVCLIGNASGSELRGFAITGSALGFLTSGVQDLVLDQLWVHDLPNRGLGMESALGPTSATLTGSLIEQTMEVGVHLSGSQVTLEDVVVRGTSLASSGVATVRGINLQQAPDGTPALASLRRSVVESNESYGLFAAGSEVTLEGVVVRNTLPHPTTGEGGRGINLQPHMSGPTGSSALLRGCVVEDNHEAGVAILGSQARLEGVVVRRTLSRSTDGRLGRGISVESDADGSGSSTALVTASLVEHNREFGVVVSGSEATLERLVVRGTLPRDSDGLFGRGITFHSDPINGDRRPVWLRGSVLELNHEAGVAVFGQEARLEGLLVRATLLWDSDFVTPRAIGLQSDPFGPAAPTVVSGSLLDQNEGGGLVVHMVPSTLAGVVVRATSRLAPDETVGDGVMVIGRGAPPTSTSIAYSTIAQNARAGVVSFGGDVSLLATALSCNTLDLVAETGDGEAPSLHDLGDNRCGCGESEVECVAKSSGLEPPAPLARD